MRYVIFVIDDQTEKASGGEMAAIDAFNEMLEAKGHWITAAGINHGEAATVVDNRAGAGVVTPGSLYSEEEHYSGFWLINAPDHETALALASEGSKACNRKVELRPYLQ
ncbi:MAG: YciI family protein [Microbacteriaceae bacterium]